MHDRPFNFEEFNNNCNIDIIPTYVQSNFYISHGKPQCGCKIIEYNFFGSLQEEQQQQHVQVNREHPVPSNKIPHAPILIDGKT